MKPATSQRRLGQLGNLDPDALETVSQSGMTEHPVTNRLALEAIDIALLLNEEEKFLQAAMVLCNELNARFKTAQVSLGWIEGGHVHLKAISNTQRFQKKTDMVRKLQWAMEEASDQDEEVVYPKAPDDNYIFRENEKYLVGKDMDAGVSLPLRVEGQTVGVITLERPDTPFTQNEIKTLRLTCDLVSIRMRDLELQSQWIHRKMIRGTRKAVGTVLGFEHTWTKLGVLLAIGAIAALFLFPWFYRVEATVTLKADTQVHVPAPFDGFIDQVIVRNGDPVEKGDTLLSLDKKDLILQEAESLAKLSRFETQARTARTMGALSDSNLARLDYMEEEARLEMIRHKLALADLKAPYSGIIVEGDLRERIGSPVSKGDPLFRIATLDDMHLRMEVDERDVHEISVGGEGQFAFSSRPDRKYRFTITTVEPSALPKQEGSVFVVRAVLHESPEEWWRPGMNGVAKIDVGNRTIFWVLTHRLVDFIRMKLWI